ncbi:unnamed protein product [Brassica rapa subsp. narinosa]
MWCITSESTGMDSITGEPTFTICCNYGQIKLPPLRQHQPLWCIRLVLTLYGSKVKPTT